MTSLVSWTTMASNVTAWGTKWHQFGSLSSHPTSLKRVLSRLHAHFSGLHRPRNRHDLFIYAEKENVWLETKRGRVSKLAEGKICLHCTWVNSHSRVRNVVGICGKFREDSSPCGGQFQLSSILILTVWEAPTRRKEKKKLVLASLPVLMSHPDFVFSIVVSTCVCVCQWECPRTYE